MNLKRIYKMQATAVFIKLKKRAKVYMFLGLKKLCILLLGVGILLS